MFILYFEESFYYCTFKDEVSELHEILLGTLFSFQELLKTSKLKTRIA